MLINKRLLSKAQIVAIANAKQEEIVLKSETAVKTELDETKNMKKLDEHC